MINQMAENQMRSVFLLFVRIKKKFYAVSKINVYKVFETVYKKLNTTRNCDLMDGDRMFRIASCVTAWGGKIVIGQRLTL
jgi:hypothetical protein